MILYQRMGILTRKCWLQSGHFDKKMLVSEWAFWQMNVGFRVGILTRKCWLQSEDFVKRILASKLGFWQENVGVREGILNRHHCPRVRNLTKYHCYRVVFFTRHHCPQVGTLMCYFWKVQNSYKCPLLGQNNYKCIKVMTTYFRSLFIYNNKILPHIAHKQQAQKQQDLLMQWYSYFLQVRVCKTPYGHIKV